MSVHQTLKSIYFDLGRVFSNNRLVDTKWFFEQEANTWNNWVHLPLRERVRLWRRGYTSPCGKMYDFDTYSDDDYLSELQKYRLFDACNGNHRYLVDDKLSQHWMLSNYADYRPAAYGLLDRGYIHGTAHTTFEGDAIPVSEWLPEKLRRESKLVLKHLRGKSGKQVLVCEHDGDEFKVDGTPVTEEELCTKLKPLSNYLVTDFVNQHSYADDLYPNATNTVRLLTIWDDIAGEIYTAAGSHRIGTDRSRPVDNFDAGGLSVTIDRDTGKLHHAIEFTGEIESHDVHPDTGAQIVGTTVPHWKHIRSKVEQIARDITNIPIIGWDVILDESGDPKIIEANTGPGIQLHQMHKPLLTDPKVARFVARYLPDIEAEKAREDS